MENKLDPEEEHKRSLLCPADSVSKTERKPESKKLTKKKALSKTSEKSKE
jgi:hypothetical protein